MYFKSIVWVRLSGPRTRESSESRTGSPKQRELQILVFIRNVQSTKFWFPFLVTVFKNEKKKLR